MDVPTWLYKLRDHYARAHGLSFIAPDLRAYKTRCEDTFGGRWFAAHNGIGVILHPMPRLSFGVAVHEMTHWLKWAKYGDEPGEHDEIFFQLVVPAYRMYGVSLRTAKEIEQVYPESWNRAKSWEGL